MDTIRCNNKTCRMTEEKEICVGVPKLCGLNLLMQTHSQLVPLRGPLVKGFNLGKKKIHTVSSCLSITTKKNAFYVFSSAIIQWYYDYCIALINRETSKGLSRSKKMF